MVAGPLQVVPFQMLAVPLLKSTAAQKLEVAHDSATGENDAGGRPGATGWGADQAARAGVTPTSTHPAPSAADHRAIRAIRPRIDPTTRVTCTPCPLLSTPTLCRT